MKNCFLLLILLIGFVGNSQKIKTLREPSNNTNTYTNNFANQSKDTTQFKTIKTADYNQYRIITLQKDTTYVDTSLTIKKEYAYNYLRKDIFGLLPFSNEGHTYTVLNYGLKKTSSFPEIGLSNKHFNYLQIDDINYYSVATPVTELYFKTVMEQGQSVDAFVSVNTNERLNFSVAYKGLRSLGKYINQLSSNGNFRFTTSYATKFNRYVLKLHYTGQDFLNGENGGITTVNDFESGNPDFDNRARLEVYNRDAKSFLKGKRYFIDHQFRINKNQSSNNLYLTHKFYYETKFYEYNQATVASTVGNSQVFRFGDSYVSNGINDHTRYNRMYNKVGLNYENNSFGTFTIFTEDLRFNYYFNKVLFLDSGLVPNRLKDNINTVGGQYQYRKGSWNGIFTYSNSITNQSLSNLDAKLSYSFDDTNKIEANFQLLNKMPDHIYNLNQSSFVGYNWSNDFKNEKISNFNFIATTKWINVEAKFSTINDFLYFSNNATNVQQQIISPKQYDNTINYLSISANKEFSWWKLALDNTILYQNVTQDENIINVPELTLRNSLYFKDYFFKRALYLQTGFIVNYFSKHYMNDFNPVINESFVQTNTKIGNFPMVDFFVNARIRQTRIFLKAEHFNTIFSKEKHYFTAPNYPYRDFMIRFGLVWNFFQ